MLFTFMNIKDEAFYIFVREGDLMIEIKIKKIKKLLFNHPLRLKQSLSSTPNRHQVIKFYSDTKKKRIAISGSDCDPEKFWIAIRSQT
jgi:hypothetical protein